MASRRRFLAITATAAASATVAAAAPALSAAAGGEAISSVWRGTALGASASMTLVHPDRDHARATIERCVDEIERLEAIFSLYRPDSALVRLNAAGRLVEPPSELVELLSFALALARRSGGAFDPTVQPLYRLYAEHFARPGAAADGPPPLEIAATLKLVDHEAVEVETGRISLHRPRMAITLNGVAQGFVTDRVGDLLRRAGFTNVLIDIGEALAIGHRADGREWRAAIADPAHPGRTLFELAIGEAPGRLPALATSSGLGTRFGPGSQFHHLLDPRSGRSADYHAAVSVAAPRATLADGLSTALAIVPPARVAALVASWPDARAWFVDAAGGISAAGAGADARTG